MMQRDMKSTWEEQKRKRDVHEFRAGVLRNRFFGGALVPVQAEAGSHKAAN